MKRQWQKLLILFSVFTLCIVGGLSSSLINAKADTTDGTYSPSNVFTSTAVEFNTESTTTKAEMYDGSTLQYKKDLALKWVDGGAQKYFSFEMRFPEIKFTTATLTMQTERYSNAEKNVQDNTITFSYDKDATTLTAKVNDETAVTVANPTETIKVEFIDDNEGEFSLALNNTVIGTFNNIGKFYSNAISTSTKTIVPLTLKVSGVSNDATTKQVVELISLNNQSFALTNGKIIDDKAPVLVLNEPVQNLIFGRPFSYDYECLDVVCGNLTSTVKETNDNGDKTYYTNKKFYLLTSGGDASVVATDYKEFKDDMIFFSATSKLDNDGYGYIDIKFNLSDKAGNSLDYDLGWYANPDYYKTRPYDGENLSTKSYLVLSNDVNGPQYVGNDGLANPGLIVAKENYQALVTEAAKDLYVGEGAYFYLPSVKGLIFDNESNAESLTYSIYYKTESENSKSSTSLSYSNLRLSINETGSYIFKIIASDKRGNKMIFKSGAEDITITESNIWDIEEIPQFSFEVTDLKGPKIEDSEVEDSAYTDVQYSIAKFDIIASGDYKSQYKLYVFSPNADVAESAKNVDYASLYNGSFFESTGLSQEEYLSKYWREIDEYKTPSTEEKDYEDELYPDNVYEWSTSTRSFIPQESDKFYLVTCKVVETTSLVASNQKVIQRIASKDEVVGEKNILKDNIVAIVLFAVAGVSGIGIIVLLIIKPKDKVFEQVVTKSGDKVYKSKKSAKKDLDLDEQIDKETKK